MSTPEGVLARAPKRTCPPQDMCCDPSAAQAGWVSASDAEELASALKMLADPIRLRLIGLLAAAPAGEVCACDLVAPLGRSQPAVSHHLKALRESGLVNAERRGTWIWYSVNQPKVEAVLATLHNALGLAIPAVREAV